MNTQSPAFLLILVVALVILALDLSLRLLGLALDFIKHTVDRELELTQLINEIKTISITNH